MLGLPDQTPGLLAYIAARLDIDDKTDRRAIAGTGVDPAVADGWGWVRQGRMRRAALNGLLHQIVALPEPQRQRLVIDLATYWMESPPLLDQQGWPYTANSGGLTYLTLCCQATPTYCEWILCCRACYQDVEPELAGLPEPSPSDPVYVSAVERSLRNLRTRVERRGWLRPTETELWRAARRADPRRYGHSSNEFQLARLREFYDRQVVHRTGTDSEASCGRGGRPAVRWSRPAVLPARAPASPCPCPVCDLDRQRRCGPLAKVNRAGRAHDPPLCHRAPHACFAPRRPVHLRAAESGNALGPDHLTAASVCRKAAPPRAYGGVGAATGPSLPAATRRGQEGPT